MPDDRIVSIIPDSVRRGISRHLVNAGHKAEEGFESTEEDEDSITGDFLRALRKGWSAPVVSDEVSWRWRLTTRKFRGRGELATEALIGADGIVQIEIASPKGITFRKGLLFQAKNQWVHRDQDLLAQVRLMENVAHNGSAIFDYGPDAYRGFTPSVVLGGSGRPSESEPKRLGEFLAEDFLECRVGRQELWYDWELKRLNFGFPVRLSGLTVSLRTKFLAAIQVEGTTARLDA